MPSDKLRQAIAFEAARLMYARTESEYFTAKRKAAKRLCRRGCKPEDLPSNAEIRDLIQTFARMHEGDRRTADLQSMRLAALRMMRLLTQFRPRLIGSVCTGHVRKGSDIDLHLFTDSVSSVTGLLEGERIQYDLERKEVVKHGEARVFTHVHVYDRYTFELTVYAEDKAHYVFRSSITGKPIERMSIRELEELIDREYPDAQVDDSLADDALIVDPYPLYRMLLLPLERVQQSPTYHPEGDALYHSLQVFELARDARPYDEEFMLAALLHDVGKAIDRGDHVGAALDALDGLITDRTRFLIEHHMTAHEVRGGTVRPKDRRLLEVSEHFDDLMLLEELDTQGRVPGVSVCTVDEALAFVQRVASENEGDPG